MASIQPRPNGTFRVKWYVGKAAQYVTCANRPYAEAAKKWIENYAKVSGHPLHQSDPRIKAEAWLIPYAEQEAVLARVGDTFTDLCHVFARDRRASKKWGVSGAAESKFWSAVDLYLAPSWGERPVRLIRTPDVNELQAHLQATTDLAPASIRSIMTTARAVLAFAFREGSTPYDVTRVNGLAPMPQPTPVLNDGAGRYAMTGQQYAAILALIPRGQLRTIFKLLAQTGLRSGELLALTVGDITPEGWVIVRRRLVGKTVYAGTKTHDGQQAKPPVLAVGDDLATELLALTEGRPREAVLFAREGAGVTGKNRRAYEGKPWHAQTWRDSRWWPLMAEAYAAGIIPSPKEFDPHSLRHFAITETLALMPTMQARSRARHTDLKITQRYQTDRRDEYLAQAAILTARFDNAA